MVAPVSGLLVLWRVLYGVTPTAVIVGLVGLLVFTGFLLIQFLRCWGSRDGC